MKTTSWLVSTGAWSIVFGVPAAAQEVRGPEQVPAVAPSSAGAVATGASNTTAPPADSSSAAGGLADIVVTARKVSENLQRVPVAITAFSGAQLQQQSATKLENVADLTPGLVIRAGLDSGASATFSLRGQYQNAVNTAVDPSVGVYVDGYYWARSFGVNADLLDVASVQVLKGPQGTLFGRNTTGGAILLQTNDPNLSSTSGLVSATYGRFDERSGTAILNLPLITDKLAIRGAYQITKRDGYVTETLSGTKLGTLDSWTGRVKLLARPVNGLSITLSAERFKTDSLTNPFRAAFISPTSVFNLSAGFEALGAGPIADRIGQGAALLGAYTAGAAKSDTISLNTLPRSLAKTGTYTGTMALATSFGEVKLISGYREVESASDIDLDGTGYAGLVDHEHQNVHQFSTELQTTGKAFAGALNFAGGVFYFRENGLEIVTFDALPVLNPNNPTYYNGSTTTTSKGVYGQSSWHVASNLSLTAGVRYSDEGKGIVSRNRQFAADGSYACLLDSASLPTCALARHDSFSGFSYLGSVDYQLDNNTLLYAKTTKGFRSGGENLFSAGTVGAFVPFQPEKAYAQEAGIKTELFDRRLRVNLAGYYTLTKNIQRQTIVSAPDGRSATIIGNAGKARFWGGEAEVSAAATRELTLSATAAYTNSRYLSYIDPNTGADRSSEFFENVPKWTATFSAGYTRDVSFGRLLARIDYIHTGLLYLAPQNNVADPYNAEKIAQYRVPSSNIINARLGLTVLDSALDLALFGRNITNSRDTVLADSFPEPLGIIDTQRREPATYGISATYRFGTR